MKSSQLKIIVILILLALNISLLTIVVSHAAESAELKARTEEQYRALLASYGARLTENGLPETPQAVHAYEAAFEPMQRLAAAAALIGACESEEQGGGIYLCETEAGTVRFRGGGHISARFSGGLRLPVPEGKKRPEHALELLASMGYNTDGAEYEERPAGDGGVVVLYERFSGLRIFNCSMTFTYDEKGLLSVEGRWLYPSKSDPVPVASQAPLSVESVLLPLVVSAKESGSPVGDVKNAEFGYIALAAAPDVIRLTPVWLIDTDGEISYINAFTGVSEFPE